MNLGYKVKVAEENLKEIVSIYKNIAVAVSADYGTGWNCPIFIRGICWL